VGLRDRLRLAYNFCARYVFGIRRSEHISGYSARILGLPFSRYYNFRICCQMYRILSLLLETPIQKSESKLQSTISHEPLNRFGSSFVILVDFSDSILQTSLGF
jgi:hypothetical protein